MIFRIDDFPAPDGPCRTTHSPKRTSKVTPATAGNCAPPCRCMVKVLVTSTRASAALVISNLQHGGDQQLRIGLAGIVENLIGQARLDHLAVSHHHDPV